MTATLRATTRGGLTAREALAWWQSAPAATAGARACSPIGHSNGCDVVGYAISARAATWWRLDAGVPRSPSGEVSFDGVYELVGFDGDRELRWRNTSDGVGHAVVLADDPAVLPAGGEAADSTATRLDGVQERLLAGQVRPQDAEGWYRLTAARYAPADVPVVPPTGFDLEGRGHDTPVVVLESVEYVLEDGHGNLTAVDRRHTRLRLRTRRDLHLDHRDG
jgi:CRISPR-associated protein (TIGR03984 family)